MNAWKRGWAALAIVLWTPALFGASSADLKKLYNPIVQRVADKHRVDPELIHAIIRAESDYDSFALSEKGAMGLMQLMPDTATQYGVRNVFDAAQNIEGGTKYLKDLIRLYNGKTKLVLAAYNAGQEAVKKYGGKIPPYQETRDYISRIMTRYNKAEVRSAHAVVKIRDASGRTVLTNDPELAGQKKDF
ncbi:MAG: lytic transglycosylase domain-containing protein [Candidatus Aminicenantales bacterium]|jgi:soluble lytic murein transglycosylase-like protein